MNAETFLRRISKLVREGKARFRTGGFGQIRTIRKRFRRGRLKAGISEGPCCPIEELCFHVTGSAFYVPEAKFKLHLDGILTSLLVGTADNLRNPPARLHWDMGKRRYEFGPFRRRLLRACGLAPKKKQEQP